MKNMRSILTVLLVFVLLSGCSTIKVSDYADRKPLMIPEDFFNGRLTAHGVIKNRAGKVVRYFNADIKAWWEGTKGTLEEDFTYDNGETQRRVWILTRQANVSYIGTAGDVVGEAIGKVAGNSMFFEYVLEVPYGDGTISLTMDDRMYLVEPQTLVNESVMYKFGFRVGEVILVIRKQS
jgi:uncharacterized protein DUF3833